MKVAAMCLCPGFDVGIPELGQPHAISLSGHNRPQDAHAGHSTEVAEHVQTILTEAGLDMSKWATEDHFVSWIGFSPRNDVSGGKVLKKKTRKVVSRLATALRMAATTLRQSDSYLGAQFRRLRTRLGAPKAITAMGAKLARLVYRMLKYGQEYVDKGTTQYEARYREQQVQLLRKKAAQHGFTLVSLPNPA